jgi:hypothetical protein
VIGTTPGIFQRAMQLLLRRATSSIETQGGYFENFRYFQQAVTLKLRFRKPMFKRYFFLYCDADLPSVGLVVNFPFTLYMSQNVLVTAVKSDKKIKMT